MVEVPHSRVVLVVPLGHGVGQISLQIDLTSAVSQLATRCLILRMGFVGQAIWWRRCRSQNYFTRATVRLGIGPHSSLLSFVNRNIDGTLCISFEFIDIFPICLRGYSIIGLLDYWSHNESESEVNSICRVNLNRNSLWILIRIR